MYVLRGTHVSAAYDSWLSGCWVWAKITLSKLIFFICFKICKFFRVNISAWFISALPTAPCSIAACTNVKRYWKWKFLNYICCHQFCQNINMHTLWSKQYIHTCWNCWRWCWRRFWIYPCSFYLRVVFTWVCSCAAVIYNLLFGIKLKHK